MCLQNFFSHFRDLRGSQNLKSKSRDPATPPFGLFFIFRLVSLTSNLHAKFEVCIFSRSRDIRGSQNLKSKSRDLGHAPFWPIFHFSFSIPYTAICMQNLRFVSSAVPEILGGSQNLKSSSRDLGHAPFWQSFHLLVYYPLRSICMQNLKFSFWLDLLFWRYSRYKILAFWQENAYWGQFLAVLGNFDPLKLISLF